MNVIRFPASERKKLSDYTRRWTLARIVALTYGEWLVAENPYVTVEKVSEESSMVATVMLALADMHPDDIHDLYDSAHAMPGETFAERMAAASEIRKWALAFVVASHGDGDH